MKLEQFRYLLEINRLQSISAASRTLHIGQTTLSSIVKSCEREIGFTIFLRTPSGVSTTPVGEQFIRLAWEINLKYEHLLALRQRSIAGAVNVNILLSPILSDRLALPIYDIFRQADFPGNLSLTEMKSEDISNAIIEHTANLGIGYLSERMLDESREAPQQNLLTIDTLLEDRIYLFVSKFHPLAQFRCIDITKLYQERLATVKSKNTDDMILGSMHAYFRSVTSFSNLSAMCQAISEQGMIGFLPGFAAKSMLHLSPEVFCMIVPKNTSFPNLLYLCLLRSKDRGLRPIESKLAAHIHSYFKSLGQNVLPDEGGDLLQ